ncbi:MAG: sugar ABC transporter ATP-binding protein [Solirubrobacterales bacterium]
MSDALQVSSNGRAGANRPAPGAIDALQVLGVSKTYPGTKALKDVNMSVRAGELHALVGGNGSGKSTLAKCLAGVEQANSGGTFVVAGHSIDAATMTPSEARANGLRFVHQDPGVFPELTVAENLTLGYGFETGIARRVRWQQVRRRAAKQIELIGLDCKPDTILGKLSAASRTMVAIARALQDQDEIEGGVLVLDEPTAALPEHEAERLIETLRRLVSLGGAVLMITHHPNEVVGVTDRVSVLRDGRLVATLDAKKITEQELIDQIVGRSLEAVFPEMPEPSSGKVVLEVDGLSAKCLHDVSLKVHEGEVVGIAGLLGTGRTTLLRSIFGDYAPEAGTATIDGRQVNLQKPRIRKGVGYVPEDRGGEAAFADLSIRENLLAASIPDFWSGVKMGRRAEAREANRLIAEFGIKAAGEGKAMSSLSGGNQQKAILARWLRRRPRLLLLDEPTQGVDVGARAEIYQIVRKAVTEGVAVLLVASDFEELTRVCDRILVLRNGRFVAELQSQAAEPDQLAHLAHLG